MVKVCGFWVLIKPIPPDSTITTQLIIGNRGTLTNCAFDSCCDNQVSIPLLMIVLFVCSEGGRFEEVRGPGSNRQTEDPSKKIQHLELGNKFNALQES